MVPTYRRGSGHGLKEEPMVADAEPEEVHPPPAPHEDYSACNADHGGDGCHDKAGSSDGRLLPHNVKPISGRHGDRAHSFYRAA
jgi:hypothetical protein